MVNDVLVVTGGGSGIGLATVRAWLDRGGRACVLDREPSAVEPSDALEVVKADVTVEDELAAGFAIAAERFGRVDAVFHCAGILGAPGIDPDGWRAVLDVHLTAALLVAAYAPPLMPSGGALVFASSIAALRGSASHPAYAAAKAGLHGLARSLARSLGPRRIRVNVVAPGSVVGTRIGDAPTPAELSRLLAATPLRRLGQPADIAEVVCFLCSPAARHVTGTTVVVDGGESLGC